MKKVILFLSFFTVYGLAAAGEFSDSFIKTAIDYILTARKNESDRIHHVFCWGEYCDTCSLKAKYESDFLYYLGSIDDTVLTDFAARVSEMRHALVRGSYLTEDEIRKLLFKKKEEAVESKISRHKHKQRKISDEEDTFVVIKSDHALLSMLTRAMFILGNSKYKDILDASIFYREGKWVKRLFLEMCMQEETIENIEYFLSNMTSEKWPYFKHPSKGDGRLHTLKISIVKSFKKILQHYMRANIESSFYALSVKQWNDFSIKKKRIDLTLLSLSSLAKDFLTNDKQLITINQDFFQFEYSESSSTENLYMSLSDEAGDELEEQE